MRTMHTPRNIIGRLCRPSIRRISLLTLAVMTVTCIRAEEKSGSACEKVLVHTNKTIYAAGEDILYRVYTANPLRLQRTIDSRILYFTLRGSAGQTLEWRINLTAPDTWGRYRLPDDMIPGVYQLLVYTSQMRNLPSDSLSALNVLITSLTKTLSDTLKIPPLPGTGNRKAFSQAFAEPFPGDGPLTVTPDTLTCAMGSSNTLSVSFNGMAGDTASLSVSVSLAAPVEVTGSQDSRQVRTGSHARMASGCVYPLENHGYVVSGRLTEKETGVPVPFGKVLLSVKDTVYPQCRFARTDSSGRFSFYLDRWYDNRELVLQAGEVPGLEEFTWKLDPKSAFTGNVLPVSVVTGEAGQLAVDNQIKARLIEAIYNPVPESRVLRNHTARIDYFRPVSFSVAPADYQELVNFKEIADNILPGLKFISRNKSYVIQVINSKTGQWSEARMILLNGIPFTDFSYLSTLGTKDISRIDIITNDFLLGDYTFHGLVAVYTHDGLVPESYLKNHGLVLKNEVARAEDTPPPDTQVRISARDPDYRTGLLWMPDVKLPSGKVIALPLQASRTPGVYRVVVNGMDRRGTPVSATAQVTVK
jgi:hypothetical protein